MLRWIALSAALIAAVGIGLLLGYARWARPSTSAEPATQRPNMQEAVQLRAENQQLRGRVESLTKEQERLAQENDILRKEQETQRLLGGKGRDLPELPPK